MENGPQVFMPPQNLKNDIGNMNLTNRLIKRCKKLSKEQRSRYIELGKVCQECNQGKTDDTSDDENDTQDK
jgi:hypothetical protein